MNNKSEEFVPFQLPFKSKTELAKASAQHYNFMDTRRSCRYFSDKTVPREVIENVILTAASAPSGAHKQPWKFVAISDPAIKRKIREAAEKEEKSFYQERATDEWLKDLAPLGTDWQKPFLETVPWIIVVFKKTYEEDEHGKHKNYYVNESVGIATGFLRQALHHCGLATLTHTPSPMNFLAEILKRPANEKPFLLLPVGFPASDAVVPRLKRKPLAEVADFMVHNDQ